MNLKYFQPPLKGIIDSSEIYDKHFNFLLEETLNSIKKDTILNAIGIGTKIIHNNNTQITEFILSINNKHLKNKCQVNLTERSNFNYLLGENQSFTINEDKTLIANNNLTNFQLLDNLIKDLEINQYESSKSELLSNNISQFSYSTLTKLQKYEWSDELIKKSMLIKAFNSQEAIELLDKALKLDPLSKEVYMSKGLIYEEMNRYDKAREEYMKYHEICPNEKMILSKIKATESKISQFSKSKEKIILFLNKKHKN